MENNERLKVFIGQVKKVQTKYGEMTKIAFGTKDVSTIQKHANDKGWSNWNLKESKSGTFYLELDTWQPKENNQSNDKKEENDLPF